MSVILSWNTHLKKNRFFPFLGILFCEHVQYFFAKNKCIVITIQWRSCFIFISSQETSNTLKFSNIQHGQNMDWFLSYFWIHVWFRLQSFFYWYSFWVLTIFPWWNTGKWLFIKSIIIIIVLIIAFLY